ncbi:hypothetical protein MMC11_003174 [Xylographa trunciseda]|nr:hypothetical protein [Xylographa trunciseda]
MQKRDPPLYLKKDYAYWQSIASRDGVAAVLAEWGDPETQSRVPTIGRTLQDALEAVEAFRPRLTQQEVVKVFKLFEDPSARAIRKAPISTSPEQSGATTPDSKRPTTDFAESTESPHDVWGLSSEDIEYKKIESMRSKSTLTESKKVKFKESSSQSRPQEPQSNYTVNHPANELSTHDPPPNGRPTSRPTPHGSLTHGSPGNGSPPEDYNSHQAPRPKSTIDNDTLYIQLYPSGASPGDGSDEIFRLRSFLSSSYRGDVKRFKTRHLSIVDFEQRWPNIQAAADDPFRWDVPTEMLTYNLRQTANIIGIRDDRDFREAVRLLREELSGDSDDNIITFYLRPKIWRHNWKMVDFTEGAPEILVHDADGPLPPTIGFEETFRDDLLDASEGKLLIMGVQAMSLAVLQRIVNTRLGSKYLRLPGDSYNIRMECVIEGGTNPLVLENDSVFHSAIRHLQMDRAQSQDKAAPLILRVKNASDESLLIRAVPEVSGPEESTPGNSSLRHLAPGDSRPESSNTTDVFDPESYNPQDAPIPPNILQPPETPLPKEPRPFKKAKDSSNTIPIPWTGLRASELRRGLIDDEGDDIQEATGAFTISLDLLDRSVNRLTQDISMQVEEFLIQSFHCPPRPIIYLGFPGPVNKDNYRHSKALVFEELFNDVHLPGIVSLKLVEISRKRHEYRLSTAGKDYPYRGRGPVSSPILNSSAIDSCLVAARLLDVGRLRADTLGGTTSEWHKTLNSYDWQCIQAIDSPWEVYKYDKSISLRDGLYDNTITVYNDIIVGDPLHNSMTTSDVLMASRMWEAITMMASQFSFTTCHRTACMLCLEMPVPSEKSGKGEKQVVVNLDELELKPGATALMADLLTTYFGQSNHSVRTRHDCRLWEVGQMVSQRLRLVTGALPLRLVVRPPTKYANVQGATSDRITFRYSNFAVEEVDVGTHQISYRWLGGIYQRNGNRRVYWVDGDYSAGNQNVKFYDGKQFGGCIVGGFKSDEVDSRVPAYWAEGTELLFYERLNEDNKELVLSEAEACVRKLRGEESTGLMSTIVSFFSPRKNAKRSLEEVDEDAMDMETPWPKKLKLGSPFQYVPPDEPDDYDDTY